MRKVLFIVSGLKNLIACIRKPSIWIIFNGLYLPVLLRYCVPSKRVVYHHSEEVACVEAHAVCDFHLKGEMAYLVGNHLFAVDELKKETLLLLRDCPSQCLMQLFNLKTKVNS